MLPRSVSYKILVSRFAAYLVIALLAGCALWILTYTDGLNIRPYRLSLCDDMKYYNRGQLYDDLNGDGKSEFIIFTRYSEQDVIEVFTHGEQFQDVIHCRGKLLDENPSFFITDTDHDGQAEIYLFTLSNDSVLLNGYQVMGGKRHFLKDHYLACYDMPVNNRNNLKLVDVQAADLDSNGYEELIFLLRAGFSLEPRQLIMVEPATGRTNASVESGAGYTGMYVLDKQRDKGPCILTGTHAIENYEPDDPVLFNDNSGWIIGYNADLSDTLLVKAYPMNKTRLVPIIKGTSEGPVIFAMVIESGTGRCFLEKLSMEAETLKRVRVSSGLNAYDFMNAYISELQDLVILHADTLFYFDTDLVLIKKEAGAGRIPAPHSGFSLAVLREAAFIPLFTSDQLVLRDRQLRVVASVKLKGVSIPLNSNYSVRTVMSKGVGEIAFSDQNETTHFRLTRNRLFPFRFLVYVIVYVLFVAGFYGIFRLQIYLYNRRYIQERRIAELQLQAVQSQLQPHFTFNVLNTIGSMIFQDKKEEAYRYLNSFSDMLRSTLLSRLSPEWPVRDELRFISTYVEMENLRFDNKFSYIPVIGEERVLDNMVPKLAVQSFVENAVHHGLMHKTGDCQLHLRMTVVGDHIRVEVEDNGIGRKAAARKLRHQTGLGNTIFMDFMEVYNSTNKIKFELNIEDLADSDGVAAGTRVVLMIPNDFHSMQKVKWRKK